MGKPFYWHARRCWYYKSEDRRNIGLDPDEQIAIQRWSELTNGNGNGAHTNEPAGDLAPILDGKFANVADVVNDLAKLLAILEELAAQQEALIQQLTQSEYRAAALREQAKEKMLELARIQAQRPPAFESARPS